MVSAVTKYQAKDGQTFDTKEEAKAHEAQSEFAALIGLTAEDISDALIGAHPEVANALESIGSRLARKRLAEGHKKRERAPKAASVQAPAAVGNGAADLPM